MFENNNYAELEILRDELLHENLFNEGDEKEATQAVIESISAEMERRESMACKRMILAAFTVNALVLVSILYLELWNKL